MRDHVTFAHTPGKPCADFPQQLITGAVPLGIVDALEIIKVEEKQREGLAIALGQAQQQVELLGKQASVRQRGQAVVIGHLPQPILGLGNLQYGLVQFRVAPGQLRCALFHFHAEQLVIHIHPRLVVAQAADNPVEDGGDLLTSPLPSTCTVFFSLPEAIHPPPARSATEAQ